MTRSPRPRKPRSRETEARYPGICGNPECGQPFVAKRPHAKYCSDYCRDAARDQGRYTNIGSKGSFEPTKIDTFYIKEADRRKNRKRL